MPLTTAGTSVPQTLFVTVSGAQVKVTAATFSAPAGYTGALNAEGDFVLSGPPSDGVAVTITPTAPSSAAVTKTVKVLADVDELGTVKDTANAALPAASATLDSLTDVVISSPTEGQVVKYTSGQWVNGTDGGGGGGTPLTVQNEGSSLATAAETLNFVGAAVTASGTGATKTITITSPVVTAGTTVGQIPVWDGDSYEPQLPTPVTAADVAFTPTGTIAATNVQAAIAEVASEAGTGSGTTTVIYKTANQTVNNSATLVNDTHLLLPIAANQTLIGEVTLFYSGDTAADFKYALLGTAASITVESSPIAQRTADSVFSGQVSIVQTTTTASGSTQLGAITSPGSVARIPFRATAGANAGNILLQWAQAVATASDTIVRLGSHIVARPVV